MRARAGSDGLFTQCGSGLKQQCSQAIDGQFTLDHTATRRLALMATHQKFGIHTLVVIHGVREGNQYAGDTRRSQFGNGQRTRAANHQIGPGQRCRHIVDKGLNVGINTRCGIRCLHCGQITRPRLVTHARTLLGKHPRHGLGHRIVQSLGAKATADHQHMQRFAVGTTGVALFRHRQPGNLRAHRITYPFASGQRVRETG